MALQDANQNTQVRESRGMDGKAGRPQRREARGSERPGGPVVGGLGGAGVPRPTAHGSNPTPGSSFPLTYDGARRQGR